MMQLIDRIRLYAGGEPMTYSVETICYDDSETDRIQEWSTESFKGKDAAIAAFHATPVTAWNIAKLNLFRRGPSGPILLKTRTINKQYELVGVSQ